MKEKQESLQLNKTPDWVNQDNIEFLNKQDFLLIVRFFVINTPDKKTSARAKIIIDYGIENESVLFDELIGDIPVKLSNRIISKNDLEEVNLSIFPPADLSERLCVAINKDKPVTSVFIKIRDSLAHGRFNFGGSRKNPILIMEDINTKSNCSARMVLRLSTLKSWIAKLENNG